MEKKTTKTNSSKQKTQTAPGSMLEEFFIDELKDIYWAEKHLVKALGKLAKNATTTELKQAFEEHQTQTEEHVTRLEQVFELMNTKAQAKKCEAMDGLTKEAETVIEDTEDDTYTRDVALIISAQKAEHYEIAAYGGLVTLAKQMSREDVAEILAQTLEEEKQADSLLTSIAENNINEEAFQEEEEA